MADTDSNFVYWNLGIWYHDFGRNVLWLDGHASWGKEDGIYNNSTLLYPW